MKRRALARDLRDSAIATVVLTGIVLFLAALGKQRVDLVALVGCSLALVILVRYGIGQVPHPKVPTPSSESDAVGGSPFDEFRRIRERLWWGNDSADYFDAAVRSYVTELMDDRLRRLHGIDTTLDPARVEALVGQDVWAFVHNTSGTPAPSLAELERIVERIEAL